MNNTEVRVTDPVVTKPSFISRLSCKRFIAYAIVVSLLFGGVHLLGFREHTGILSGTASPNGFHEYYGAIYVILYISFVVFVPILLIASLLTELLRRIKSSHQ